MSKSRAEEVRRVACSISSENSLRKILGKSLLNGNVAVKLVGRPAFRLIYRGALQ